MRELARKTGGDYPHLSFMADRSFSGMEEGGTERRRKRQLRNCGFVKVTEG